jgi:hypothetical protein
MKKILLLILLCFISTSAVADSAKLIHVIRFSDYETGSEKDWLSGKGFKFKHDARRRNRVNLEVINDSLVLEAKRRAFGIMPNETVNIPDFTYVEIDWGINKFPEGSSYEQGVRNEAIMVIIFMGDENKPSGSIFIPNSPCPKGAVIQRVQGHVSLDRHKRTIHLNELIRDRLTCCRRAIDHPIDMLLVRRTTAQTVKLRRQ